MATNANARGITAEVGHVGHPYIYFIIKTVLLVNVYLRLWCLVSTRWYISDSNPLLLTLESSTIRTFVIDSTSVSFMVHAILKQVKLKQDMINDQDRQKRLIVTVIQWLIDVLIYVCTYYTITGVSIYM